MDRNGITGKVSMKKNLPGNIDACALSGIITLPAPEADGVAHASSRIDLEIINKR
jgi:hypothetical protein